MTTSVFSRRAGSPPPQGEPRLLSCPAVRKLCFLPNLDQLEPSGDRLSGDAQLPNVLQHPPEAGVRGKAHGSIRVQEGDPHHRKGAESVGCPASPRVLLATTDTDAATGTNRAH
jgi:hypothetical protein